MISPHLIQAFKRLDSRLAEVVDEEARRAELLAGDGASGWAGVRNLARPETTLLLAPGRSVPPALAPTPPDLPFGRLARALGLDPVDVDVLLLLLAPFVEPRYQSLYALLQDDPRQPLATERLVQAVLGRSPARRALLARGLAPGAPLLRSGLVRVAAGTHPPLGRPLTLPPEVAAALLDDPAPPIAGATRQAWLAGGGEAPTGTAPACQVFTGAGGVEEAARARLPNTAGAFLARLDPDSEPLESLDSAWRLGLCLDAWPVLDLRDLSSQMTTDLVRRAVNRVRELGGRLWLLASGPVATPAPQIACRPLPWSDRVALWSEAAAEAGLAFTAEDARRLGSRHRLGRREIAEVLVGLPGETVETIDRAARDRMLAAPRHALLRVPRSRLDDLVLRAPTRAALDRLVHFVDNRDRMEEKAPATGHFPLDAGPIALFHGRPGTGKTMAAEAVAGALGRPLHIVDVSQLVSKYVGETEKHIDETLSEAEFSGAALLFDEADGLFTTRVEKASSAGEQFSNMVVGYLLQRMERHDGLIMLATNLAQSIDDAFMRRFLFRVEFPLPDAAERWQIWERLLAGRGARDVEYGALGRDYRLSGGEIRNAAMKAIFLADRRDAPLDQALAEEAVRLELFELGRLSRTRDPKDEVDRGFLLRAVGNCFQDLMDAHLRGLFLKEIHVLEGPPTDRNLSGYRPALSIALFSLAGRRSDGRRSASQAGEGDALRAGVILSAWSSRAEEENEILGAAHACLAAIPELEVAGHAVKVRMQESHDFDLLQRFWTSHDQPMKPSIVLDLEIR